MILNEAESFQDVRYLINLGSDDFQLSFVGLPRKTLLPAGTALIRLDFPIVFGVFMKVWWVEPDVWRRIVQASDGSAASVRTECQRRLALPEASKNLRTQVFEIELTSAAFGWKGKTSALFGKPGGEEQVYLPNLSKGSGPYRSDFARLHYTYTLPDS